MLAGDACSRPLIIIRSHDLHACDIIRAMGDMWSVCLLAFFWPLPFCFPYDGSGHQSFIVFLFQHHFGFFPLFHDKNHNRSI